QTGITKTGSPRLRRILTEAAWQHRFPGTGSKIITARRSGQPALVVALAEKASLRLHKKFRNLQRKNSSSDDNGSFKRVIRISLGGNESCSLKLE
ncbi:IS110 family transposase, partial [Leptospira borgpetersenii serovar Hardjo-bovis]|nr:IS110 family transposase [Leptospira borgpetersenii serovar Hardjo-bovis]MBF3352481.1 IS110 family transposase [Leptospira borgpetersenii serovar Hardjo-bovis]MBF3354381.1 IS110 family transposase [Leptospira borgpetersenii serovar Hardjo-bovis]MBF3354943.1 IS110 family transposase [Leptospira borgpetersenii serovar Hardjo-bovis]